MSLACSGRPSYQNLNELVKCLYCCRFLKVQLGSDMPNYAEHISVRTLKKKPLARFVASDIMTFAPYLMQKTRFYPERTSAFPRCVGFRQLQRLKCFWKHFRSTFSSVHLASNIVVLRTLAPCSGSEQDVIIGRGNRRYHDLRNSMMRMVQFVDESLRMRRQELGFHRLSRSRSLCLLSSLSCRWPLSSYLSL